MIYSLFLIISAYTVLALNLLFMSISLKREEKYMKFWSIAIFFICGMFLLDAYSGSIIISDKTYHVFRELLELAGSWFFLEGSLQFFQQKTPSIVKKMTFTFGMLILLQLLPIKISEIIIIPNLIFCSMLVIVSAFLFLLYSWDKTFHEKVWVGGLLLVWSILMNQTGFRSNWDSLTGVIHICGIITIIILMFLLILVDDKKSLLLNQKLTESLRMLVEHFSDSMFLFNYTNERFEYVSKSIVNHVGAYSDDLYKDSHLFCANIADDQTHDQLKNIFDHVVQEPGSFEFETVDYLNRKHRILMQYIPVHNENGMITSVEGILRDITRQKEAELELQMAEERKNQLLENIAHEIKTPITLIQGYTETILEDNITDEQQKTFSEMLYSKAHMLSVLADDFAQAMTSDSSDIEYRFYEKTAGEIFNTIINQCRDQVQKANCHFELEENWNPENILVADQDRIQQAVSNLINNAIRHTPNNSSIKVSILMKNTESIDDEDVPDGMLQFYVSDNGKGFDSKELPYIFKRNYSKGKDLTGKVHGLPFSGLGLYISKNIIESHGGKIYAYNRKEGGACVWFELPYYRQ